MHAECTTPLETLQVKTLPQARGNRLTAALSGFFRRLRHRFVFEEINQLDDHQLADIGLMREDLRHARDLPILSDRVSHLVQMRRDPLRGIRHR